LPTVGSIKIKGRIASLLEVGTGFHPELSGRDNIFQNGALLGMTKKEITKKFDEIVDFSGVERYVDTPVKRYSSGMYVRLAFSVAAHLEPEILIVDEVLAVGDVEFQKKCLGKMQDVNSKDGRTILFVSHNMGALKTLCSRGICLSNGQIAFNGGIQSAIDFYNNENQSDNKGSSSLFIGKQTSSEQKAYIKKVELLDYKNTPKTNFDVHDKVTVLITICCIEKISGCTPIIDVKYNGSLLFKTFLADKNPEVLDGIDKGEHTYSFIFPIVLKKGIYSLGFHIGQLYNKDIDFVEDVITFHTDEISESLQFKSYSSERQGLIAINQSWATL
jgi:lipopolysaccharide transport system ATP-binding protein